MLYDTELIQDGIERLPNSNAPVGYVTRNVRDDIHVLIGRMPGEYVHGFETLCFTYLEEPMLVWDEPGPKPMCERCGVALATLRTQQLTLPTISWNSTNSTNTDFTWYLNGDDEE